MGQDQTKTNQQEISHVNKEDHDHSRWPVHSYHRDGQTRFDGNGGGAPSYQPNSSDGPADNAAYGEPPLCIDGNADRYNHR